MLKTKILYCMVFILLISACGPAATAAPANGAQVIPHPDGPLYVGDKVSFEVLFPHAQAQSDSVEIKFKDKSLGSAGFSEFGLGGRSEAALWWVWDTSSLAPGPYTLTFIHAADGSSWEETYLLHPAKDVPPPEPQAKWAETTTECCIIHYITGTAAARDIAELSREADEQSADIARRMDFTLKSRIDVTLMPRVIGQGGFTTSSVYLSYLDGNYMGNEMPILFHHEFVHFYDGQIGGGYRPSLLEEGWAVYLTGGHFKPEPLAARAHALLDLGYYIPLDTLANDFYKQQHDIGYLEGATVIQYLVEKYGLDAFTQFFRNIQAPRDGKATTALDEGLKQHFNISLADLEPAYKAWLKSQPVTQAQQDDLRLTLRFFDSVRRYQKGLDPSAYFLTAWLPDGTVMRQRGIVADFLRRPRKLDNRLIEPLFVQAWKDLAAGKYPQTERLLDAINGVLGLLGK